MERQNSQIDQLTDELAQVKQQLSNKERTFKGLEQQFNKQKDEMTSLRKKHNSLDTGDGTSTELATFFANLHALLRQLAESDDFTPYIELPYSSQPDTAGLGRYSEALRVVVEQAHKGAKTLPPMRPPGLADPRSGAERDAEISRAAQRQLELEDDLAEARRSQREADEERLRTQELLDSTQSQLRALNLEHQTLLRRGTLATESLIAGSETTPSRSATPGQLGSGLHTPPLSSSTAPQPQSDAIIVDLRNKLKQKELVVKTLAAKLQVMNKEIRQKDDEILQLMLATTSGSPPSPDHERF